MRDGIYRVSYKAGGVTGVTAVLVLDRDVVGCDSTHTFTASIDKNKDWLTTDITCRRHTKDRKPQLLPEIDECHLRLQGPAKNEFAKLHGSIAELPGVEMDVEFVWLCEL